MRSSICFFALIGSASAACSGDSPCSGKGSCGQHDKCSCYVGYTGQDCSERTCNHHTSWNAIERNTVVSKTGAILTGDATYKAVQHSVTECSSKGDCDRDNGQCKCFDGYTGKGCRRMSCDGGSTCSGHGRCRTLDDLSLAAGWYSGSGATMKNQYTGWDGAMVQSCDCDAGWEGDSCSSRMCARGDDILTTDGVNEVQFLGFGKAAILSSGVVTDSGGQFIITYTDGYGNEWETWAIDAFKPTAISIKEALQALPNDAIPTITVTMESSATDGEYIAKVEFTDPATSGPQPKLAVQILGCVTDGCLTKYVAAGGSGVGVYSAADGVSITLTDTAASTIVPVAGTKEFAVCSNRGKCDGEVGRCECFTGYMGVACEQQNANF